MDKVKEFYLYRTEPDGRVVSASSLEWLVFIFEQGYKHESTTEKPAVSPEFRSIITLKFVK